MQVLENGWTLIAHSGCIVLAMRLPNEYAVWRVGAFGETFWGQYYSDLVTATAAYADRLKLTAQDAPQTPKLKEK